MRNDRYYTRCITFGRAREGLHADFQEQLRELQQEIGFDYVRFHGLFHDDMAVYDEDGNGEPVLWFGYIDKLFDFLLSVNIKPFVELGFMPVQLATVPNTTFWWQANGCPPTNYDKWHYLVRSTVLHLTERYGIEEVKTWYFEVWNEPNLSSFFQGTQEDYFRLYRSTVAAVKSVCADYRVGGPSTSGADFREGLGYLKAFIDFCASEDLPVDFFSAHPYPTYWPLDTKGMQRMGYMKKESTIEHMDHIRSIVDASPYANAEIHLTEWNSSPSPRDLIHDTPFMAPYIIYNVAHNFGKADSLGFWTFTDVFEENGPGKSPFHGGFGLMNADGVKKPSYWAYWLLNKLGDEVVQADDHVVITRSGEDFQIILYNYCYYRENFARGDRSDLTETSRDSVFENRLATVDLELELQGTYRQTVYRLDRDSSALHNWVDIGAPKYPTQQEIAWLKQSSRPAESCSVTEHFSFHQHLVPQEVRMFVLNKIR